MAAKSDLVSFSFEVAGVKQLDRGLGLLARSVKEIFTIVGPDLRDDFIEYGAARCSAKCTTASGRYVVSNCRRLA